MTKAKKYLFISIIVILSFIAGFGLSGYLREKNKIRASGFLEMAGYSYYDAKDTLKALQDFYGATFLNPNNGGAHFGIAYIFYEQGQYDLSLKEFQEYLRNPHSGFLTMFLDNENESHTRMEKHNIAWAYCYMGDIYEKKGDTMNSLMNYRKARESDPDFIKYLETYINFINDKKYKDSRHIKKLEKLTKTLAHIKKADGGT